MLLYLSIKNLAIIENLEFSFEPGLTILSGETGAGKSIVLQALSLLMGEKASSDYVRSGEEECLVQAIFEKENEELRIKRSIQKNGKSRVWINEALSSVSELQKVGSALVEYISQHESSKLFDEHYARELLDSEGDYSDLLESYQSNFQTYQSLLQQLKMLHEKVADFKQKQDFYLFQKKEIEAASLKLGEEEELLQKRKLLQHASKMSEALKNSDTLLYSGKASVLENLNKAISALQKISGIDDKLDEKLNRLQTLNTDFEDLARDLSFYASKLNYDDSELTQIEDRLEVISKIKKKYALSVEALLEKLLELQNLLSAQQNEEDLFIELEDKIKKCKISLLEKAGLLSATRQKCAKKFSLKVQNEIADLALRKAAFELQVQAPPKEELEQKLGPFGYDEIDFMFAPNLGEEPKKLSQIASGGELSRVILALRTVLKRAELSGTFIFDEIDAGMSGAVAEVVGKKILALSKKTQVLCVTHLPQVAALGNQHFYLFKQESKGRTQTQVKLLSAKERQQEIARMFAGEKISQEALKHAEKLLAQV